MLTSEGFFSSFFLSLAILFLLSYNRVCEYVWVGVYVCMCACVHVCISKCVCVCVFVYLSGYVCVCACVCVSVCVCLRIHLSDLPTLAWYFDLPFQLVSDMHRLRTATLSDQSCAIVKQLHPIYPWIGSFKLTSCVLRIEACWPVDNFAMLIHGQLRQSLGINHPKKRKEQRDK